MPVLVRFLGAVKTPSTLISHVFFKVRLTICKYESAAGIVEKECCFYRVMHRSSSRQDLLIASCDPYVKKPLEAANAVKMFR